VGQPAVSFYVLATDSREARLRFACRITDRAWKAGNSVLILHQDPVELALLDDLLWTEGGDLAFLPHEIETDRPLTGVPVVLKIAASPGRPVDVVINLRDSIPGALPMASRVVEIIDSEPARRETGRARFKAYRELGIAPDTHNIGT
jgi:DNA polymerase-3 subunit chi